MLFKNGLRILPRHRRDAAQVGPGVGRIKMRRAGGAGGAAEQVPPYVLLSRGGWRIKPRVEHERLLQLDGIGIIGARFDEN